MKFSAQYKYNNAVDWYISFAGSLKKKFGAVQETKKHLMTPTIMVKVVL